MWSVVVGAITGAGVTGLHLIVDAIWGPLAVRNDWWIAVLPLVGLLLSSILVSRTRDRSTATTEEYIQCFHDPSGHIPLRASILRLGASLGTISLGGSMGLEGPSILFGATIGDLLERRLHLSLDRDDTKVLLVAGAAAGIAAIFKAPVTGIIFALEVPFQDDLARHALIPAIFAASTSYLVFVSFIGTAPLFPVEAAPLRLIDLLGSLVIGVACGLAARGFVRLFRASVRASRRLSFWLRPMIAGSILAVVGATALALYDRPLPLGPGYTAILLAARGQLGAVLLIVLLVMKAVATSSTAAGNGVGGLFFPSVLMGAALGGALGHLIPGPASLFAVVGIASFLGGAYMVPLAGVAFVAEATGAPGYIIPGLLAAAVGYLVSGRSSLSEHQRSRRPGDLERRLRLSVAEVMSREWTEVNPTVTLADFVSDIAPKAKSRVLPVAEAGRFVGAVTLDRVLEVPTGEWGRMTVEEVLDPDPAVAEPRWPLERALGEMQRCGSDSAAVIHDHQLVGTLTWSDILRMEEILARLEGYRDGGS